MNFLLFYIYIYILSLKLYEIYILVTTLIFSDYKKGYIFWVIFFNEKYPVFHKQL